MSRVCEITGKKPAVGNRVSHANNKKRRRFLPNLHAQRFWLETEKRWVTLRLTTAGMRTVAEKESERVRAALRAQAGRLWAFGAGGANHAREDQAAVDGRNRPLLRDHQEQAT